MQERLQKILSQAGVASRRKAEELIRAGRVLVNGKVVTELGSKADPDQDFIKVDGKLVRQAPRVFLYLMLNKPKGCVTTTSDPQGRPTVTELLGRYRSRVYPVGRLDYQSEGLLLFTNDGEFAHRVLSAKSRIPKTYRVKINGNPSNEDLQKLRAGVRLDGKATAPTKLRRIKAGDNPWFEVTLIEGRNNQIRRMFRRRGFLVEKLKRIKIGPLALAKLPMGKSRRLTEAEIERLRRRWAHKAGKAAHELSS